MAIRVNMLVERLTTDAQPRSKNGHPPQSTTGEASSSSIQGSHPFGSTLWTGMPGSMSAMAIASSGTVNRILTQKRLVIARSSGFSSTPALTVRGSSAMPQIGHAPGPGRTISGCIGQVYSTRAGAVGISRSRAIPHLGHGPGWLESTSAHMGQM